MFLLFTFLDEDDDYIYDYDDDDEYEDGHDWYYGDDDLTDHEEYGEFSHQITFFVVRGLFSFFFLFLKRGIAVLRKVFFL